MLQPRRTLLLYLTIVIISTWGLFFNNVDCETGNYYFLYLFLGRNLQIIMITFCLNVSLLKLLFLALLLFYLSKYVRLQENVLLGE